MKDPRMRQSPSSHLAVWLRVWASDFLLKDLRACTESLVMFGFGPLIARYTSDEWWKTLGALMLAERLRRLEGASLAAGEVSRFAVTARIYPWPRKLIIISAA